jgi:toxin ParE1/3/4
VFKLGFSTLSISSSFTPYIGLRTEDPVIRRLTTSPYPYLIFYEVTETEVIIHAVRHGARDPSGMPGST